MDLYTGGDIGIEDVLCLAIEAGIIKPIGPRVIGGISEAAVFRIPDNDDGYPVWIEMVPTKEDWVFTGRYNYVRVGKLKDPFEVVDELEMKYRK